MGKRKKSTKPQGPKKREPLSTTFQCLFCNHEHSVTVKIDKKANTGDLMCKVCGQHFQTGVNYLSAAVDVYSDWVDACDSVAKQSADVTGRNATNSYRDVDLASRGEATAARGDEYDDDDGFVENDEVDPEAEYA